MASGVPCQQDRGILPTLGDTGCHVNTPWPIRPLPATGRRRGDPPWARAVLTCAHVHPFSPRQDVPLDGLNAVANVSCKLPEGTFCIFAKLTEAWFPLGRRDAAGFQEGPPFAGNVAVSSHTGVR